jgi:hypothetical protein
VKQLIKRLKKLLEVITFIIKFMTSEEIKAIEEIQGTGGFRVIQSLVEAKLKKLESVMGIKRDALVAEQALARQLAFEALKEFLSDLQLTSPPEKDSRNTYE